MPGHLWVMVRDRTIACDSDHSAKDNVHTLQHVRNWFAVRGRLTICAKNLSSFFWMTRDPAC